MEILHVSAECYPMAKVGGLADVVGALPKYQHAAGNLAKVIMPMHRTDFLIQHEWAVVYKGDFIMDSVILDYTIIKLKSGKLGFDLFCVDIFGLLDRENVYGYDDDSDRYLAFQIAVADWLCHQTKLPDVIHVHDHHAGLLPFMMRNCYAFATLSNIPIVLTIHNAQYQGWMPWVKAGNIPHWNTWNWGLLDWDNLVNPLASAIKCVDKVTTVSRGYLRELFYAANGLENLMNTEHAKCVGLLNGIDYETWDPATDSFITDNYDAAAVKNGKKLNKRKICDQYRFDIKLPLFVFIGRMVADKGADLLAPAILSALEKFSSQMNFMILGSGDPDIENSLKKISGHSHVKIASGYNEKLSHQMYAGADFILMPSRVEPCGLNQMYAMRYGTIPVTRNIGGLRDTIIDFGEENGYGVTFNHATIEDILYAISRCLELFDATGRLAEIRKKMMQLDNSWEKRAGGYTLLYESIKRNIYEK